MGPLSNEPHEACLGNLVQPPHWGRALHDPALHSPILVISVFPQTASPTFLIALNEFSRHLQAAHPGARHYRHSLDVQRHPTSHPVQGAAEEICTQLLESTKGSLQAPTSIILLAYGIGINVVQKALAFLSRCNSPIDRQVLQHVQGLLFHDSPANDKSNEHIDVYLPVGSERNYNLSTNTTLTSEHHHVTFFPGFLSFGVQRTYQHRICFPLETIGERQSNVSCYLPTTVGRKDALVLALDAVLSSLASQHYSISTRQLRASHGSGILSSSAAFSSASIDVNLATSQLVWQLFLACTLLSWSKATTCSTRHRLQTITNSKTKLLTVGEAHSERSIPTCTGSACNSVAELTPTVKSVLKPVKHATWPVTRYDSSSSQCRRTTTVSKTSTPSKATINRIRANWESCVNDIIAQYRLLLILVALAWNLRPGSHIVQCPTGRGSQAISFHKSIEGSPLDQSTGKAPKRSLNEADNADSDRSKRLDIGTKIKEGDTADRSFPCPYYKYCPSRHQNCWRRRWLWKDVRRLKGHLYEEHARVICNATGCHLAFRDQESFGGHTLHRTGGSRDFADGFDQCQKDELKGKKRFRNKIGQQYYDEIWKILFPEDPGLVVSSNDGFISRQEHDEIVQDMERQQQDRLFRLYREVVGTVRSISQSSELLSNITSVFNREIPSDAHFRYEEDPLDDAGFATFDDYFNDSAVSYSAEQVGGSFAVGADYQNSTQDGDLSEYQVESMDEDDLYDDGGVDLPPLPTTPLQLVPRGTLGLTALGRQSALMRNDFLDVPRDGAEWNYRHAGVPSSPSGLETRSSSSPVRRIYQSSSNQEAPPRAQTPMSSAHEEDIDFLAGEAFRAHVLPGVVEDRSSSPDAGDTSKRNGAGAGRQAADPEGGAELQR